jgi:hypothetical protein
VAGDITIRDEGTVAGLEHDPASEERPLRAVGDSHAAKLANVATSSFQLRYRYREQDYPLYLLAPANSLEETQSGGEAESEEEP